MSISYVHIHCIVLVTILYYSMYFMYCFSYHNTQRINVSFFSAIDELLQTADQRLVEMNRLKSEITHQHKQGDEEMKSKQELSKEKVW